MKGKVKFAVAAVLLAAFVAMFAGEALAAQNPNWVSWTWKYSREADKKKDISSPDYWWYKVEVTFKNNSQDRDIVAIYDRKATLSAPIINILFGVPRNDKVKTQQSIAKYDKAQVVNIWPGRSHTLVYWFPAKDFVKPHGKSLWGDLNHQISERGLLVRNEIKFGNHTFSVRSKKSN